MKEKGQTGDRVDQTVRPGSAPKAKVKEKTYSLTHFASCDIY